MCAFGLVGLFGFGKGRERPAPRLFILRHKTSDATRFPVCVRSAPPGEPYFAWCTGRPLAVDLKLPLLYDVDFPDIPLEDWMRASSALLVSKRFWAIIEAMSSGARGYESQVWHDDQLVLDGCYTVHLEKAFPCMDWSRSKYGQYDTRGGVRCLRQDPKRLVLDPARVPPDEGLFLLGDCYGMMLCTEVFKAACEGAGLTGVDFLDFQSRGGRTW